MGLSYPQIWSPPYPEIMVYPSLEYSVHGILRFVSSVIECTIQGWCTPYTQKCGRRSTISSDVRLPYRKAWCLLYGIYRVHLISSYLVTLYPNLFYTIVTQLKVYDLTRSFLIYWLSNSLTLSVPDVCHFRNVSYTLSHICTFLLEFMNFFSNLLISFYNLLVIL